MKKVVIKLGSPNNMKAASQMLTDLSGVMVTDIKGDTLIVHCGQRLDSRALISKLQESGYPASAVEEAPGGYF